MRENFFRVFYDLKEDYRTPFTLNNGLPTLDTMLHEKFPAIEMCDSDSEVLFRAEMPGMSATDINIEVTDTYVSISGGTPKEKLEKNYNLYHSEFHHGSFFRRVALPPGVKAEIAKRTFKKGILEIRFPKQVAPNLPPLPENGCKMTGPA